MFEAGWSAAEEMKLLEAISDCGIGNWVDIAHQVQSKSKQECEQHYMKHYIEQVKPPLPVLEEPDIDEKCHSTPIVFKLSDDPPRPPNGSQLHSEMSGYMAARGDFNTEYDNYAELDLRDLDFNDKDDPLEQEIKLAVSEIYQNVLKERWRRKRIVRDHGLINLKKVTALNKRYDFTIKSWLDDLRVLMRLLPPHEWEKYIEALHYTQILKQDIKQLCEFRAAGIKRIRGSKLYLKLNHKREKERSTRSALTDVLHNVQDESACSQWLQKQAVIESLAKGYPVPLPSAPRKSAPPLDIIGMPGYERLTNREREMCAMVRLVPEAFLEFKTLLVNECAKQGYLKLAQARLMIKIDVNKTRKIYDFLISEGMINKNPLPKVETNDT